jgi:type II secretory pathway component PulF
MAFCIKCGAENPAAAGFCHKCGQSIYIKQDPAASAPPVMDRSNAMENAVQKPLTKLIIVNVLLLGSIEFALVLIAPIFAAMFADFGAKLPMPTQLLIDWADFPNRWWWGGDPVLGPFAAILAICFAKRVAPRKCLRLALAFQILLLLVIIVSLFLPIFQLGSVAGGLQ